VPQLVDSKSRLSANVLDHGGAGGAGQSDVVPTLPGAATDGFGFGGKISADHGPRPLVALLSVLACVVAGRSIWAWYAAKDAKNGPTSATTSST